MNRMTKAVLAILFIAVIAVSAVSITRQAGKSLRLDITDRKLYTLSDGTKAILAGLKQPITIRLFYSRTASIKAPDQIRFYTEYAAYVKAILEEYVSQSAGKVKLEIIDPRPYTEEEMAAIRYGLKRFTISEEENFFFGLVIQTQFGVTKTIEFFSPDRQNFVEYDISYLVDTATTRQKTRISILSSLPVMGEDVSGYMAYMMRMQGQQPKQPWGIVQQLKEQYEVKAVAADTDKISDVDVLLVIGPKNLPQKTLFAIDQYILNGGRAIIFVDPHCVVDRPNPMQEMGQEFNAESNLNPLLKTWGLEMPGLTFAGDRTLAVVGSVSQGSRPEKVLSILRLTSTEKCFDSNSPAMAMLNEVNVIFPGVLNRIAAEPNNPAAGIAYTPLMMTSDKGNAWKVDNFYELASPDYAQFLRNFRDGTKPVVIGYMLTGKFKSAFPNGVEVEEKNPSADSTDAKKDADKKDAVIKKKLTGLAEAKDACAMAVFADVDFISDIAAYRPTPFGMAIAGDNSAVVLNLVEELSGSNRLMAIRSRGSYSRPFIRVQKIETEAEAQTIQKETEIQAQIKGFEEQLKQKIAAMDKKEAGLINKTIVDEQRAVELKLREAEKNLRDVKMQKVQRIERLGTRLENFCMLPGPILILAVAVALGLMRSFKRRHYISHASDS